MYRSKLYGPETYNLENAMSNKNLHSELVGRFGSLSGFSLGVVANELKEFSRFLEEDVTSESLADFWNNDRTQIERMFTYNPVVRHPELSGPDQERIDASFFSILLATVMKEDDLVFLDNPDELESPLADELGAYAQRGTIHIGGPSGDGLAHHSEGSATFVLDGEVGHNLGFMSKPSVLIIARSSVGKHSADHVIR